MPRYPPGIIWQRMSLDVRQHSLFNPTTVALSFWELEIAKKLELHKRLARLCKCHVAERIQFKYFIMGLHLVYTFFTSGHYLIAFHILQHLSMGPFSMVVVFLPSPVCRLIARSSVAIKHLILNTRPVLDLKLNVGRLKWCLLQPATTTLFSEYKSLQPFYFASTLDTLDFATHPIKNASFNPVHSAIAFVTTKNVFYVYCYGRRSILFHSLMHDASYITLSWSPKGTYLYTIEYQNFPNHHYRLDLFQLCSSSSSTCHLKKFYSTPIKGSLNTKYLWISDVEILFSTPKSRPQTNLIKLKIDGSLGSSSSSKVTKEFFFLLCL